MTACMALRKVNGRSNPSSISSIEELVKGDHHDESFNPEKTNPGASVFSLNTRTRSSRFFYIATAATMLFLVLTYLTLSLTLSTTFGQSTTTNPPAPSGTAVAGTYNGILRPQIHFTPPEGFMNDPNGLFLDAQGIYHMYYQLNPTSISPGNQHWGHATSADLYSWTNQKITLFPYDNVTGIFTGSCVIDVNNTSGFFPDQNNGVVAIYTGNGDNEQNQRLAYSFDDGYTFTQYDANPVLAVGNANFRDPKVIWHAPTDTWVMVVAFAMDYTVAIYTSANLRDWEHASNFTHVGLLGLLYECPNLVAMPYLDADGSLIEEMYLMYISINPGAPLGGSVGQFFPGHFNGTHFEAVDGAARIADFGKDNYATQFWYEDGESGADVQGRKSVAWASNWQYTGSVPSGPREGWRSAMTVARRNWLENRGRLGWSLMAMPVDLSPVVGEQVLANDNFGNGSASASVVGGGTGAMMLQVNATDLNEAEMSGAASLTFTISSSQTGERIKGGQFFSGQFWLDRGKSGWGAGDEDPFFTDKVSVAVEAGDTYQLLVIVDRSVIEVFLDGGVRSGTQTFFPTGIFDTIEVDSDGLNPDAQLSVAVWALKSGWALSQDGNGRVTGNATGTTTK